MSNPSDPYNRSSDPQQPQQNPPPQAPQPPQGPPGYGTPPPGYNAPPPGYGTPPGTGTPAYGAPGSGGPSTPGNPVYGTPPGYPGSPAYGAQPGYGTPQPGGYAGPPPGYGAPQAPGYGYPPAAPGPRPPYASWIQRVGGALIDGLLVGVLPAILYGIGFGVGIQSGTCVPDSSGYTVCTGGGISAIGLILIFLAAIVAIAGGLYLIYQVGTTGQTPGKRVVGIRLIGEADGQVIGFGMAFVRNLCHVLDGFCYIGYLWPLWDDKRQTFADKIMHTIVVQG
ncbi:RDD family protein [Nocardia macrotermitis]|uniref:RDD domain-containing protein n=1 Tax=Nocardia macrotermitis TaxID=2585198 RepID=A0A7K0D5H7_9NOCA|nr:RDD family protein [Nocardia macrotermitis]MQY20987.1 hypothetical protein [Nocardia macrotermitis]